MEEHKNRKTVRVAEVRQTPKVAALIMHKVDGAGTTRKCFIKS